MNGLDAEMYIDVVINDVKSSFTYVNVYVAHLKKDVQVKIPHNIQKGQKIKLKGLGHADFPNDNRGDLYLTVRSITITDNPNDSGNNELYEEKIIMQKMLAVELDNFNEVNGYLETGWRVKEFKPFKNGCGEIIVYVLIEK